MSKKKIIGLFLAAAMAMSILPPVAGYAAGNTVNDIAGAEYVTIAKAGIDYAYVRGAVDQIMKPYIKDDVFYMSLRNLAEITNSPIEWNRYTKKATVYYLQYEFEISDGSDTLLKKLKYDNSVEEYAMRGKAEIINDIIYVPVDALMQAAELPCAINGEYAVFGRERFTDDVMTAANADYSGLFLTEYDKDRIMKTFYIDPETGRDEGIGTSDDPFRTITGAKLYIRDYKKNNPMTGNIIVYLRGGNYSETLGVQFTPEDSGENGYHVQYVAYPGETPHITSAKKITDWEIYDSEKNIYASFVGKGTMFQYMVEDEQEAIPARWPNEGYLHAVASEAGPVKTAFVVAPDDIPEINDPTSARIYLWPGRENGETMWFSDYYGIGSFDKETGAIKITSEATYVIGTGSSYYFENAYEFLDKAKMLVKHLNDPQMFKTEFPISSIAVKDKTFGTDMWRGPVWINYNYMICDALDEYGYNDLAEEIRNKTVSYMNYWYRQTGTLYEFYDSENKKVPSVLNRKGAFLEPYNLDIRIQSIRDYGWSCTLLCDMLAQKYMPSCPKIYAVIQYIFRRRAGKRMCGIEIATPCIEILKGFKGADTNYEII